MNALALFKPIKLFVFDVDGVLTDGNVLLTEKGEMSRCMSIKDGYALQLAIKKGYQIVIISGGKSAPVALRLKNLGVSHIFMGILDKKEVLATFMAEEQIAAEEVLYMGDDMPDIAAMLVAGLACCPADAVAEVKVISAYISPKEGGKGCVRDVIEKVLKLNDNWGADDATASA